MSWDLPFGVRNLDPKGSSNVDDSYGYYTSITEACDTIKPAMRKAGRTVGILRPGGLIEEYWWVNSNDLSDGGLVPKFPSTYSHVNLKYRVIKPAEFFIEGDFPNQSINANLTPESPFIWEYDGVQFTIDTPISFQVSLDNSIYERWDAICLTPNGSVELIEGQRMFIGDSIVLPVTPSGYYLYSYVHWTENPRVINPRSISKTSDLINDGEDGANPFISYNDFYRENTLIDGSIVHIEDYSYLVWVKEFVLNRRYYNMFIQDELTLEPSHQSLDRIDVFVLNDDLTVNVITGVASSNPIKPSLAENQIEISFVIVKAGSTEPSDIENSIIYDENLQKQGGEADTSANSSRIDLASTEESSTGGVSIKFDSPVPGDTVSFFLLDELNKKNVDSLIFHLKLKESASQVISIGFLNLDGISINNLVKISPGKFGYNPSLIDQWQIISIPISSFSLGTINYSHMSITVDKGIGTFYIDHVYLQSGVKANDNPCCGGDSNGVQSVTGDGVGGTPEDVVLTFPTPTEIGAIEDAPSDGKVYGRKDAVWKEIGQVGGGDMLASMYDPTNVMADAFDYNNMYNTPDIEIVWGATEW